MGERTFVAFVMGLTATIITAGIVAAWVLLPHLPLLLCVGVGIVVGVIAWTIDYITER